MPKDQVVAEKKDPVKNVKAQGMSLRQFAIETGVPLERLQAQFNDALIKVSGADDIVSEEKKQKLLRYLQEHHGAKKDGAPEKIILRRAKTSEIKVAGSQGARKTISVQVRKKRTYIKRPTEEQIKHDTGVTSQETPLIEANSVPEAPVESVKDRK